MGNICRSPTAEGLFRRLIESQSLEHVVEIDSAGTESWHIGRPPDERAQRAALRRGVEIGHLRGRQVQPDDFDVFDYILAMDSGNLQELLTLSDRTHHHKIRLLMQFGDHFGVEEVPDPYYGGEAGFDRVIDMIEAACSGLLADIQARIDRAS
jgi:protein-tyrosine phosphatase